MTQLPSKFPFTLGEVIALVVVGTIAALIGLPYLIKRDPPRIARIKDDMTTVAIALEAYFLDHKAYPPSAAFTEFISDDEHENLKTANGLEARAASPGSSTVAGLTTPIAYLTHLMSDRFAPDRRLSFFYYPTPENKSWILISPGPDTYYDIDPKIDVDLDATQPTDTLVIKTYDPTNGTVSRGDVWRVKQ